MKQILLVTHPHFALIMNNVLFIEHVQEYVKWHWSVTQIQLIRSYNLQMDVWSVVAMIVVYGCGNNHA